MKEELIEIIELELAFLGRHIISVASNGTLDRAAYLLLHQLQAQGAIGVKALASSLRLDVSTVSRQASSLDQKGYVIKVSDNFDRRAYSYQITDLGKQELNKYKDKRIEKIKELLADWEENEQQSFGSLLMKFNKSLKKE
ncbi:MarR family winged helix-turn-helix transcriptional regulator [Bacillus suaedaesalsae]|uniref:MarR family transcriptional regulator n=1 Tax=Bacillus suaedaesalsae TaxID=2810349 RepID=A0ABS2DEL1_9BACI|nr:MarR family transcriptional regulator [Bacillus suaedaesalsae]MBM6616894.1 MarR family transcriptional regulator [Bacillus suaedaesalsae]